MSMKNEIYDTGMPCKKEVLFLKTSPHNYDDMRKIAAWLDAHPRVAAWSIDLGDCDKILRIESGGLPVTEIVRSLYEIGVWSEELSD